MEIIQVYQTKNPSYTRNRSITPIGVLVHSTGANNRTLKRYVDAEERLGKNQYNNHWNKTTATKSVHAFIGLDKNNEVIVAQTLPYDRACWGAGKGNKGSANYDPQAHIQFEICQGSNTDADYYWKAIAVAEKYCAYLCKEFGWTIENITSHKEAHAAGYASNHGDPQSWMKHFGDDMNKFRDRVRVLLGHEAVSPTITTVRPVLRKGDKGKYVTEMQQLLLDHGYNIGSSGVDGSFGSATLTALKSFQKASGLTADGSCGPLTWAKLLLEVKYSLTIKNLSKEEFATLKEELADRGFEIKEA